MRKELEEKIKEVSAQSGNNEPDFLQLLELIDEHYDKLEATLTQSLTRTLASATPIQVIFDSVTDALMSVGKDGVIRHCNKICTRYFGIDSCA